MVETLIDLKPQVYSIREGKLKDCEYCNRDFAKLGPIADCDLGNDGHSGILRKWSVKLKNPNQSERHKGYACDDCLKSSSVHLTDERSIKTHN